MLGSIFTLQTNEGNLARPSGGLWIRFDHLEIFTVASEMSITGRILPQQASVRLLMPRPVFEPAFWGTA